MLGLVTAALNHRWGEQTRISTYREQEGRAIRKQRREACHNYLVATNAFWQAIDQLNLAASGGERVDRSEYLRAANNKLQDTYVYLTISCGAKVRAVAESYQGKLYELAGEASACHSRSMGEADYGQAVSSPRGSRPRCRRRTEPRSRRPACWLASVIEFPADLFASPTWLRP